MAKLPLTICGETVQAPIHVCAFFHSSDEQYKVMVPYMQEGLQQNEKVINILERDCQHEHCQHLAEQGIDVQTATASKQLEVLASEETYLKDGSFGADKMLQLLEDALIAAKQEGHESVRACGEMVWALADVPGTEQLIEYEAKLNLLTPKYDCSLICMYDINRFSAQVFADVLATHPYVIMHGNIHRNPYYMDPLEFLAKLETRAQQSLALYQ